MLCRKCKGELPDSAIFCPWCGARQDVKRSSRLRGNGMGSAYKRGKTWTAVVIMDWKIDAESGSKKKLPIKRTQGGFKTKREALEYIPTLRNDTPKAAVTLDKLYQGWTDKFKKLSKSKQTAYSIAYDKISEIRYFNISTLSIDDLQSVVNAKAPTYYTAKDIKTLLSHLYDRAVAQGDVQTNLAKFIELPQLDEAEQIPFSEIELKRLWEDYGKGNKFTGYILLMIYSGMMPGELFECRKPMIDWARQEIVGCGKKTKKRKSTPIVVADLVIPVLRDLCDFSQSRKDYLLCINRDNFYKEYHISLQRIGVRDLPPYSCRHTTATALALGNIAPSVIQEVMRHTKITTTQRYIHIDTSPMLAAVNTISAGDDKFTDNIPTTSILVPAGNQ